MFIAGIIMICLCIQSSLCVRGLGALYKTYRASHFVFSPGPSSSNSGPVHTIQVAVQILISVNNLYLIAVAATVKQALNEACVQLLVPKRRIDILRDALEARSKKNPYVITFCGVNGVGKSTNLAKVSYYHSFLLLFSLLNDSFLFIVYFYFIFQCLAICFDYLFEFSSFSNVHLSLRVIFTNYYRVKMKSLSNLFSLY